MLQVAINHNREQNRALARKFTSIYVYSRTSALNACLRHLWLKPLCTRLKGPERRLNQPEISNTYRKLVTGVCATERLCIDHWSSSGNSVFETGFGALQSTASPLLERKLQKRD